MFHKHIHRIIAILFLSISVGFVVVDSQSSDAAIVLISTNQFNAESRTVQFDTVTEGRTVLFEIPFVNTGTNPLVLSSVKSSCGCLTVSWSKEPLLSGDTSKLRGRLSTLGRVGKCTKAITIKSNTQTPVKMVYIKGYINPKN